jgi:hypothetical protein
MLLLALLGLTNIAYSLPLNDKPLHFFCLGSRLESSIFALTWGRIMSWFLWRLSFLYLDTDEYGSGAVAR